MPLKRRAKKARHHKISPQARHLGQRAQGNDLPVR